MNRLKELRKEKDLNQGDVAKHLGVAVSTYHNYETGVTEPEIKHLITLSKFYDVSIDYIVGCSDIRNSNQITSLIKELDPAVSEIILSLLKRLKDK